MKKLLTLILALVALAVGCNRYTENRIAKWPSEGRLIDSLTDRFEYEAVAGVDPDSIRRTFAELKKAGTDSLKQLFLEARMMRALHNIDSSTILMKRLEQIVDTTKQKYLWERIKYYNTHNLEDEVQIYLAYLAHLEYFRSVNDSMQIAAVLVDIGNLMVHLKDPVGGLQCMKEAQEIYQKLNMPVISARCNINILTTYTDMRETHKADSVRNILLHDPTLQTDTNSRCLALLNAYNSTDSVYLLHQAYDLVKDKPNMRHYWPLYLCLIGEHLRKFGDKDSAYYYIKRAHDMISYSNNVEHRARFNFCYSLVLEDRGMIDSAYYYLLLADRQQDTTINYENANRVRTLEANRKLAEIKTAQQEKRHNERQVWTIVLLIALMVIGAVVWMAHRNRQKGKMRAMHAELELERNRHHLAARVMALEEKDKLLSIMSKGLKEIGKNPEESRTAARELENMIKLHVAGQAEWQNFVTLFEKANPKFIAALKEGFPDLPEHYVKLASYIYAGLTNTQIARLLMIRPESVHQARWRLRKRLGITGETGIEDFLRNLGNP